MEIRCIVFEFNMNRQTDTEEDPEFVGDFTGMEFHNWFE